MMLNSGRRVVEVADGAYQTGTQADHFPCVLWARNPDPSLRNSSSKYGMQIQRLADVENNQWVVPVVEQSVGVAASSDTKEDWVPKTVSPGFLQKEWENPLVHQTSVPHPPHHDLP
mmetsp:Transcript_10460/g.15933  ORF Transcript_10460/g.15933 Transcript_10460/m.15933 type:complete len:116 (-) Transcript_10460:1401-1748(-)